MKKLVIGLFVLGVIVSVSSASQAKFGLKVNAQSTAYVTSISSGSSTLSSSTSTDPIIGAGIAYSHPLKDNWSLIIEGQYNTASGYTNSLGSKVTMQVHPIEVSLQNNFEGWYLGGGLNYSLWSMSTSTSVADEQNSIGMQFYGGWKELFLAKTDLEIKYTYMGASVVSSGIRITQGFGSLSIGPKYWL
ncbi:hypothetical protein ACFL5U_02115 [Candidatus Margulisiibacteriota bacterium]